VVVETLLQLGKYSKGKNPVKLTIYMTFDTTPVRILGKYIRLCNETNWTRENIPVCVVRQSGKLACYFWISS